MGSRGSMTVLCWVVVLFRASRGHGGEHRLEGGWGWGAPPAHILAQPMRPRGLIWGCFPFTALRPGLGVPKPRSLSEGSILWPRSYTVGCCSSGAAPSCPCAWAMTSMSWGEWGGGTPLQAQPRAGPPQANTHMLSLQA